jgi:hypothetical protein
MTLIAELEDKAHHTDSERDAFKVELNKHRQIVNEQIRTIESLSIEKQAWSMDKENMIREHTLETGNLRRQVARLKEEVKALQNTAIPNIQASTYISDFDLDGMIDDTDFWGNDQFLSSANAASANTPRAEQLQVKPEPKELTLASRRNHSSSMLNEEEKPAASGVLLMVSLTRSHITMNASNLALYRFFSLVHLLPLVAQPLPTPQFQSCPKTSELLLLQFSIQSSRTLVFHPMLSWNNLVSISPLDLPLTPSGMRHLHQKRLSPTPNSLACLQEPSPLSLNISALVQPNSRKSNSSSLLTRPLTPVLPLITFVQTLICRIMTLQEPLVGVVIFKTVLPIYVKLRKVKAVPLKCTRAHSS